MLSSLIITLPGDIHAHAIAWALEQMGRKPIVLYPLDICDGAKWSFDPIANILNVDYRGVQTIHRFNDINSIWLRRIPQIFPLPSIEDLKERAAAETEISHIVLGVISALDMHSFTINPPSAVISAERKAFQLALAKNIGFSIPRTKISNNLNEIATFFGEVGGKMIYKPLSVFLWDMDKHNRSIAYTSEISSLEVFEGANVQASPAIYQEIIDRHSEVRATVMGRSIFAWEKRPKTGSSLKVDWRLENGNNVAHAKHELPEYIQELCFRLMDRLGIVFGCFDFAVTPLGEYVFFEVNSGGQFLFGDSLGIGINQLDAFAKFMESRDPYFKYQESRDAITFKDYLNESDSKGDLQAEIDAHFGDIVRFNYARASVDYR